MKKSEQILLNYVIEKSYSKPKALAVLNKYDAARTERKLEDVTLIND